MQDLRLIGVHEDGLHLLLASADGERFSVPLDDALRAAARQDRPRLGQLQIEMDGGLRPRDVQAMIRAGASAEDVAGRAGWSVEKVRKYEGPIIAERIHIADLAREVRLRQRGSGSAAATLSARVTERMRDRGVDPDTSGWDAWRLPETDRWTVSLTFAAGGRQRQAAWSFDPTSRVVDAQDDEARWLSEEEPAAGPLPGGPAGATGPGRATDVYDVEAEGGIIESRRPTRATPPSAEPHADEPLDLMTAMRERSTVRGRRGARRKAPPNSPAALPTETLLPSALTSALTSALPPALPSADEGRTDALPIAEIAFDPTVDAPPPPAHTHPDDDPEVGAVGGDLQVTTGDRPADHTPADHTPADHTPADDIPADDIGNEDAPGDDGPKDDGPNEGAPKDDAPDDVAPDDVAPDDVAEAPAAAPARPASPARKGRPSVPSWDDIMFGNSRD